MNETALDNALDETLDSKPDPSPVADSLQEKNAGVNNEEIPKVILSQETSPEKRGRGRPRKDQIAPGISQRPATKKPLLGVPGGTQPQAAPVDDVTTAHRKMLAVQAVAIMEQAGTLIAGDDAKMHSVEKTSLADNFDRYFASKNISDIPPGLALSLGIGVYGLRLFQTEKGKTKLQRFGMWAIEKVKWRKKKNAHINSRQDSERENASR